MKMFDVRRYETLVRVNAWGPAHADQFPAASTGGKLFAALDPVVSELNAHAVAEAAAKTAARQGASAKGTARDRLRRVLATLTRTAKVVTASMPGLKEKFRLPQSHSDRRFLAASRAVVQDASPFADSIVAHSLPSTFFENVTAAIDAFESSIQAHAAARELRASSRAAIGEKIAAAFRIVEQLDAVVANQCEDDAALLADWKTARHVSLVSIPYPNRKPATEPSQSGPGGTLVPQPA